MLYDPECRLAVYDTVHVHWSIIVSILCIYAIPIINPPQLDIELCAGIS